jgi:hypothetical protein
MSEFAAFCLGAFLMALFILALVIALYIDAQHDA